MENASGQGKGSPVPAEIDRWNWGAFFLHWVWGVGNNTLIALVTLLPGAILVMPFVLGIHGSKWAWQNKRWDSIEEFRTVQRKWAQAGVALLALSMLLMAAVFYAVSRNEK